MLKNWIKIITADCEVIEFPGNIFIYPIFKNGRSSLDIYSARKKFNRYVNHQISKLTNIKIYLRDPVERFISGVYTFFYFTNSQKVDPKILQQIENFKIVDRHFVPQYLWLLHLYKFYKGNVEFRPVQELYELVPNRDGPWYKGPPWAPMSKQDRDNISGINVKAYTHVDTLIISKYLNKNVKLETIVKEFKDALS